jgi:hypothetical protein
MKTQLPPPKKYVYSIMHRKYEHRTFVGEAKFNVLIERTWHKFLWWTFSEDTILDIERVPFYVWIAIATLGSDSSNWKSKWTGREDVDFTLPDPKPSPSYSGWHQKFAELTF